MRMFVIVTSIFGVIAAAILLLGLGSVSSAAVVYSFVYPPSIGYSYPHDEFGRPSVGYPYPIWHSYLNPYGLGLVQSQSQSQSLSQNLYQYPHLIPSVGYPNGMPLRPPVMPPVILGPGGTVGIIGPVIPAPTQSRPE